MDPSHLVTLRDKLLHATVFTEVWAYFLDHIFEDEDFAAASVRTRSELLEPLFDQFCLSTLKAKPADGGLCLVRYGPAHFLHGGAMVGGLLVSVLFFEDVMTGLFCIVESTGRRTTQLARFTAKAVPGSSHPDWN